MLFQFMLDFVQKVGGGAYRSTNDHYFHKVIMNIKLASYELRDCLLTLFNGCHNYSLIGIDRGGPFVFAQKF